MDADRGKDADEDAGESEAKKEGKKGHAGEQKHGKESKKGGKADRQKGAPKPKDSQGSWVKKGENDNAEEEESQNPHARKGRGDKAREKRADWKERGDKKDFKDRRAKQQERLENEGSGVGGKKGGNDLNDSSSNVLNGGALLSMLKANPPSVTRYTREELLSIGQLPGSKVKPATLNVIIDKENAASPLLVKPKLDKVARRRGGEGEEDEVDEEGAVASRRERRPRGERGRRGDSDEEEDGDKRRGRNKWGEERRWKEEERVPTEETTDVGNTAGGGGGAPSRRREESGWNKADTEWDMPDANGAQGNLEDFTLGDIRQAEKSFSKGMSMADYKASLRADQRDHRTGLSEPLEEVVKDRDDPFKVDGAAGDFFVEEEEDVSRASRGFGKWFGRAPPDQKDEANGGADDDLWDMPAPATMMPGFVGGGGFQPSALGAGLQANFAEAEARAQAHAAQQADSLKVAEVVEHPLLGIGQQVPHADGQKDYDRSLLGRSILSMIGRTEPESSNTPAEASSTAGLDSKKQEKLSVAELFNLAQGKELHMPAMPQTGGKHKEEGIRVDEDENDKAKTVLEMYSHIMYNSAARGGLPARPPGGGRYPGYQPGPPYGAVPPASFGGMPRPGGAPSRGPMMGRGQNEAIDAYAQAMMGIGRGAFPGMGGPGAARGAGGKGAAQAPWPGPMGPGYPFGPRAPGFGTQPYGPYPPDYSQLPWGPGFDGATPQGAAALQGMYGGLGASPEGTSVTATAPRASPAAEKGRGLFQAGSSGATAPVAAMEAPKASEKSGQEEGGEDESGCSQS